MKKLLLSLIFCCCLILSGKAQTPGWTKMKALNNDIATRHRSQMVSYNNKLYFLGGYGGGSSSGLNDFWEYDPATKTLTEFNTLPIDLFPNAIASSGSMFVIGDKLYYLGTSTEIREYNFITKVWSSKASFPSSFNGYRPGAFVINNILYAESGIDNTFYSYDPAANVWTQKANYPGTIRRKGFSFSINGKGYKGGGFSNSTSTYPLDFYEYNPATNVWVQKANMPSSLSSAVAVSSNGKGYVGTGELPSPSPYSTGTWYEYNPSTNTWVTKASAPGVMESSGASINSDIYLFSGKVYTPQIGIITRSFISKYNTLTDTWSTDTAYAGGNRTFANGIHHNGKIYITGGDDSEQRVDTWEYTIATNSWTRKANMPGSGFSLNGQAIIDSKLYLVGGFRRSGSGTLPVYSNALLQYDAATNLWETKANFPGGALAETGAFALNGELYAGCGTNASIKSKSFYKYNAGTNTWSALLDCPNSGPVYAAFSIGDTGYFVFGTNSTGTSIMYGYDRANNTWSLKQPVPDFIVDGGSQGGTNNTFVRDGMAYMIGLNGNPGAGFSYSKIRKYDPVADKWSYISEAPFYKKGHTIVDTGNDIYIGFGQDQNLTQSSGTYFHVENDWYKLNLDAEVSTFTGDKTYFCSGSQSLQPNQVKTFTDDEGKLFISAQAGSSIASTFCISQRSLAPSITFRGREITVSGVKYSAVFANKNFTLTSGAITHPLTLKMYFTTAELNGLVSSFNAKYSSNKTIADIRLVTTSGGSTPDLDPLNNSDFHSFYSPVVADYKTTNKVLSYTPVSGTGEGFATEVYAVLTIPTQTLTFPSISSKDYGAADFTAGVTSTNSTIPITYASSNTAVATVAADGKIHITGAGNTTITASQPGSNSFSEAAPVSQTLTVTPAALTVKADAKTKVYGSANPALTVTYTGFVNNDDVTKLITQPVLSTTATNSSPVGAYPITVSGAVSSNYTFTYAGETLTVTKAPLTIAAKNVVKTYDGVPFTGGNGLTFTGLVAGDTESGSVTGTLVYSGSSQGARNVAKYVISPSGYSAVNYNLTYIDGELSINSKPVTVTAAAKSKVYGSADPTLTHTLTGTLESGDSFTGSLARTAGESTGTYVIGQGTLSAGANYTITFVPANLTITKAALTITADDKTRVQGAANPLFTASYSGFVNSETSAALTAQPAFATTATTASAPGTYPITPSGATSSNYEITYVNGKLVVAPAPPLISSFTPTTSVAGATLTITGNYFTGATAVSLGGVPAASFTVVSATSITAFVGAGASGSVSVTTPIGTGTLAGYTFVPKPTIAAGGQTTFATGGSVVLTASPGTGFTYTWARDGVDIPGATSSTYTASVTGSYTATITANTVSQTSTAIAVSSIYVLPANNFKITATGETCKTSNNGSVNITATQSKSYTAVLTGNGLNLSKPFTTTVDFTDLQAGTYNVCVTVAGEAAYKQCFDIVITEPKDLSVFAVVDKGGNTLSLALDGSSTYFVELNGSIFKTDKDKLNLSLRPGNNTLKVYTGTVCQGVFEKNIQLFDQPMVYPNPFQDVLNLLASPSLKTQVEIRNLQGRLVFNQQFNNENGKITLALENLEAGVYVLKALSGENESIYRIIKK